MKCRKRIRRCRNRGVTLPPGSARETPEACPSGIRHVDGAKLNQALVRNVRTCRSDAKGDVKRLTPQGPEYRSGAQGGAARIRDEGSVMGLDRRGCVVQPSPRANRPNREVWEAFKRVKANQGAAGASRGSYADLPGICPDMAKYWQYRYKTLPGSDFQELKRELPYSNSSSKALHFSAAC